MAKTKGPLLSLEAHGTLAKTLNYSAKKSGSQVRKHHYPQKKVTGAQWTQRHIMGMLTARWQTLTDEEKAPYIASAKIAKPVITGFNYFVRVAQTDLKTHLGLELYYTMDEDTGDTVYDHSGQGINGTLVPTYPSNAPKRVPSLNTQYYNCLNFDGLDDNINTGESFVSTFRDSFSIGFWFKPGEGRPAYDYNAFGLQHAAATICKGGPTRGGKITFVYGAGGVYKATLTKTPIFQAGGTQWTWIIFTLLKNTQANIYVNGALQPLDDEYNGDLSAIDFDTFDTVNAFVVGCLNYSGHYPFNPFKGLLDEFIIWNRIPGTEEIKKLYDLMRTGKKRQPLIN